MAGNDTFLRFMAAWALVHETADEGWKAAVERGASQTTGEMGNGPEAFVDGLSTMIAAEKERLKTELAAGVVGAPGATPDVADHLAELRFEVAELRGQIESMQASLDALLRKQAE